MKEYFLLQYKMTNRKLKEAGINPLLGYILCLVGLALISELIFIKIKFAKYLVILISLSFIFKLSDKYRTDFLRTTFGNKKTKRIRIIENLIISIPFMIVLIFKTNILESACLFTIAIIAATFSLKTNISITIPTPFYKKPFEFIVGFRKTFYIFPIAYSLVIIAISVNNLNLGIFAMLLIFLISLSYYHKPENNYFVWIHCTSAKEFIYNKMKVATQHILFLNLPILLALMISYPKELNLILTFFIIGLSVLLIIILMKYSAYPYEISLPEMTFIGMCIYVPPIILALIPFFYIKSIKKLQRLLND
jgi:hypothetical protein